MRTLSCQPSATVKPACPCRLCITRVPDKLDADFDEHLMTKRVGAILPLPKPSMSAVNRAFSSAATAVPRAAPSGTYWFFGGAP